MYGLESCRMFVLGCKNLVVFVDHKPLIPIFSDKSLDNIKNPRLLRFKERSLVYSFKIKHIPGKDHTGADATSRYPSANSITPSEESPDDAILHSIQSRHDTRDNLHAVTWERVREAATTDEQCTELTHVIRNGFPPNRDDLPECIRTFWPMREALYEISGVPFRDHRMLIPSQLRAEVLEGLHGDQWDAE